MAARAGGFGGLVATRANALWQRLLASTRSGCGPVATRANALWQRPGATSYDIVASSRNPRECAVAKMRTQLEPLNTKVATRANALWQSVRRHFYFCRFPVATRANALWQRTQPHMAHSMSRVATRANALWQRSMSPYM